MVTHPHWHSSQKNQTCKKSLAQYFVSFPWKNRLIPETNPVTYIPQRTVDY